MLSLYFLRNSLFPLPLLYPIGYTLLMNRFSNESMRYAERSYTPLPSYSRLGIYQIYIILTEEYDYES